MKINFNLAQHLREDSNCEVARRLYGGRNLAQVMWDVFREIPLSERAIRKEYRERILEWWLTSDVPYKAPELIPHIWGTASDLLKTVFRNVPVETDWLLDCIEVFRGMNDGMQRSA